MNDLVLTDARVVLADRVLARGTVVVRDGRIADVGEGLSRLSQAVDCGGDTLIPGLVELHTDHLESHFRPRPKVIWPAAAAVQSHDAQIAGCGITTVLDALRVGTAKNDEAEIKENLHELVGALAAARGAGSLRAEHLLHLRCELACDDTVDELAKLIDRDDVRLVSLMDHTPGQRQYVSMAAYRTYYGGKTGMSAAELDAFILERREAHGRLAATVRREVVRLAHVRGVAIASHDDATEAHVEQAVADAAAIAEFPTTTAAARRAHAAGLKVLMGAPNFVRGGSHSGNVATEALAAERIVDILSSDYVPFSLLHTAFLMPRRLPSVGLAEAIGLVTREPARAVGLDDRGEIAIGLRADLVRVRDHAAAPVVRSVWREGVRVA